MYRVVYLTLTIVGKIWKTAGHIDPQIVVHMYHTREQLTK